MSSDIVLPRDTVDPDPDAGRVKDATEFAHTAYNLLDHEAKEALDITRKYQLRWIQGAQRILSDPRLGPHTFEKLMEFAESVGQDVKEEFAERLSLMVAWDPTPILEGKPPLLTVMDKYDREDIHKHGFDHEQKQFEVLKSKARGEAYLGQRERVNARRPK